MSHRTNIPPGSITFDPAEGTFWFKCPGCGVVGELVAGTDPSERSHAPDGFTIHHDNNVGHVVTLHGDGTATVEPSIVCPECDWHDRATRVAVVS